MSMEYTFTQKQNPEFIWISQDGLLIIDISSGEQYGEYECYAINAKNLTGSSGTFSIDAKGNYNHNRIPSKLVH